MRKVLSVLGFLAVITLTAWTHASADEVKMVFWYPGEAGSTEEAQPVLDAFFDYLSQGMKPESVKGRYFNTVDGGLSYINKQKPKVGIISYAAWTQNRAKLGNAKVLLATLPAPKGKVTEKYSIIAKGKDIPAGSKIYTSEPLTPTFVKQHLFPNLPDGVKLEQTDRIFVKIKAIANGSDDAIAILTPIEASSLKRLKSPWAKSLNFIEDSKSVPTARVVVFDQGWSGSKKLSEVLLSSGKDPKGAEILEEIRLKGFSTVK